MKLKFNTSNGSVTAPCPDCGGAVTTFEMKGQILVNQGARYQNVQYQRTLYLLNQCANCGRGGLAKIYDNGNMVGAALESSDHSPWRRTDSNIATTQLDSHSGESCFLLGLESALGGG